MNQRFQNEEIKRVSDQYAENEFYKAICTIGTQLENELKEFGLCPEECFVEALELLTEIAEKGEDIIPEADNLWLRKENEYRRFDRHVNDEEITKAVGIVFGFSILALGSSNVWFYKHELVVELLAVALMHNWQGWAKTMGMIFNLHLPAGWFDNFINDDNEEAKKDSATERAEPGAKTRSFSDFIINSSEAEGVISIVKKNASSGIAQQAAFVIIGGIEAGKISCNVSAPSIEREFGVKANSIKPYLTKYKSGGFYSEKELKPYKDLFCKE